MALFEAVSAPISCPQIFAGHYRGEDFNLVTDVGSREERHKRSPLFQQRGSLEMAHIILGEFHSCQRAPQCLYEGKLKATQQLN